jgi:hypothetical protein
MRHHLDHTILRLQEAANERRTLFNLRDEEQRIGVLILRTPSSTRVVMKDMTRLIQDSRDPSAVFRVSAKVVGDVGPAVVLGKVFDRHACLPNDTAVQRRPGEAA